MPLLTWETSHEIDVLGFNLYRAASPVQPANTSGADSTCPVRTGVRTLQGTSDAAAIAAASFLYGNVSSIFA
jgi:hypothetical protein